MQQMPNVYAHCARDVIQPIQSSPLSSWQMNLPPLPPRPPPPPPASATPTAQTRCSTHAYRKHLCRQRFLVSVPSLSWKIIVFAETRPEKEFPLPFRWRALRRLQRSPVRTRGGRSLCAPPRTPARETNAFYWSFLRPPP